MNNSLETVVRRLFADEEFRAAVTDEPGAALGEYGLSAMEQRSIVALCKSFDSVPMEPKDRGFDPLIWM